MSVIPRLDATSALSLPALVQPHIYIMASKPYGTLYVGVTGNLVQRAWVHRDAVMPGFTRKYGVHRLVYYEPHETIIQAMRREHNIKHWPRKWKVELIEKVNPLWDDLYPSIVG
jgi:putative endonuclease